MGCYKIKACKFDSFLVIKYILKSKITHFVFRNVYLKIQNCILNFTLQNPTVCLWECKLKLWMWRKKWQKKELRIGLIQYS